jgi:mycothiol synthase
VDLTEERASRLLAGLPSGRFRHAINAGDHAAAAMLRARGLRPVRHFWQMQIDLTGPFEPDPPPEGVEIGLSTGQRFGSASCVGSPVAD